MMSLLTLQQLLSCVVFGACYKAAPVEAGSCVCAGAEAVPVWHQPCGQGPIKTHTWGACWLTTGESRDCDGTQYVQLDYGAATTAWAEARLLNTEEDDKCSGSGGDCNNVFFVTREEWGARPPREVTNFDPPMSMVFVHHSAMDPCFNQEDCSVMMREIQDLHMDGNGWDDIGYNFLVGEDGRVYEGRGWEHQGAQAKGHNTYSYGICIMGDFTASLPDPQSRQAVRDMIDCGIKQGYVTLGHEEFGHRDGRCTACPGDTFYPQLQTWPRYSHREIPIICD